MSLRTRCAAILLATTPCLAQHELIVLDGQRPGDRVGFSVASANGWVWVGAPWAEIVSGLQDTGLVHVRTWSRSLGIQTPIGPLVGGNTGDEYGYSLDPGPVISGIGSMVIGAPGFNAPAGQDAGRIYVAPAVANSLPFDGLQAGERLGHSVAFIGDVDGDGFADFVGGAANWLGVSGYAVCGYPNGRCLVLSTNPGLPSPVIAIHNGFGQYNVACGEYLGRCVLGLRGDVNGDGRDDYVLGSPQSLPLHNNVVYVEGVHPNPPNGPASIIPIGQRAYPASAAFGAAMCAVGDVTGDGKPDFAVGAPGAREVRVIDGATGAVWRSWTGVSATAEFGHALACVGDQDGDSVPELLVGAPGEESLRGRVYMFSISTGDLLMVVRGSLPGGRFGAAVAVAPDFTGDSRPEFIVGAPDASPPDPSVPSANLVRAGRVVVFSLDDQLPKARRFGSGCVASGASGPEPWVGMSNGIPRIGQQFAFAMARGKDGTLTVLAVDFANLPAPPLCPVVPQLCGCSLNVGLSMPLVATTCVTSTTSTTVGQGHSEYALAIPNNNALVGATMFYQWYNSNNPFNSIFPGTLTKGMSVTISP